METAALILVVIVILAALSMEMKLARANRIARASHDVLKAILEEMRKAENGANVERPTPNAQSRMGEEDGGHRPPLQPETDVYRI